MINKRTLVNVATFLLLATGLIAFGMRNFLFIQANGPDLRAEFADASGLRERNDVTMRGVVVGTIKSVDLTDGGVMVDMELNPGTEIPDGTKAVIVRRSPIGELTIELEPGPGAPLADGATLAMSDTVPPPDVSDTIEVFADFLGAVPSEDVHTVVSELADAVEGRSADLARFTDASVQLPETLLSIEDELESLIVNGPKVTGVFADNADTFADDLAQTAILTDILRDRRYDLVDLYSKGGQFARIAGDLLHEEKPNISCLLADIATFNEALAARKADLAATLEKNHYFFDGAEQAVQKDPRGWTWFRVSLLPHTEPAAMQYQRPVPDVYPGRACTSRYGSGVGPVEGKTVLAPDSHIEK